MSTSTELKRSSMWPRFVFKQPMATLVAHGIRFAFKSTWELQPGKIYMIAASREKSERTEKMFDVYKNILRAKGYNSVDDLVFDKQLDVCMRVKSVTKKQGKKGPNDFYFLVVVERLL